MPKDYPEVGDAIIARLDTVERQNKWLLRGLIGMALVFGATLTAAAVPPMTEIVAAKKFVLVDSSGRPRAVLRTFANGEPQLALLNQAGKPEVLLGGVAKVHQIGPYLTFFDMKARVRAAVTLSNGGEPNLKLYDAQEHARLILGSVTIAHSLKGKPITRLISSVTSFNEAGHVVGQWP